MVIEYIRFFFHKPNINRNRNRRKKFWRLIIGIEIGWKKIIRTTLEWILLLLRVTVDIWQGCITVSAATLLSSPATTSLTPAPAGLPSSRLTGRRRRRTTSGGRRTGPWWWAGRRCCAAGVTPTWVTSLMTVRLPPGWDIVLTVQRFTSSRLNSPSDTDICDKGRHKKKKICFSRNFPLTGAGGVKMTLSFY